MTNPTFLIPPAPDNSQNSPHTEGFQQQASYFPIVSGLAYNAARDACNALEVSEFGKYVKPPRQPLLISGEFIDRMGYLRPRANDGTLISPVDANRKCWSVYYVVPYYAQIQGLMSYFDSVLKPFAGYRDIILQYQSVSDKKLFLEYSTENRLIQGDLDLFFRADFLRYSGCKIGKGTDWWL